MTNPKDADLMAWAESDAPQIREDAEVRHGTTQSHAAIRALLEDAADTDQEKQQIRDLGGRPGLDPQGKGASPMWNLRAPQALDTELRQQAEREGRKLSEVLRSAARQYLDTHRAS